jgi:uncharacterized protein (DUF952 family)
MSDFPAHVFKILDAPPAVPLPHALPPTPLDAQDGFIHLSDARQTPKTAGLFFGAHAELWLLKIDTGAVQAEGTELRWLDGSRATGCVHIHGEARRLGRGVVVDVRKVVREEGESWVDAISRDDGLQRWLAD